MEIVNKTIFNGNLTVYNVPHAIHPSFNTYIPAPSMVKLTEIFRYMLDNKLQEVDFESFKEDAV